MSEIALAIPLYTVTYRHSRSTGQIPSTLEFTLPLRVFHPGLLCVFAFCSAEPFPHYLPLLVLPSVSVCLDSLSLKTPG